MSHLTYLLVLVIFFFINYFDYLLSLINKYNIIIIFIKLLFQTFLRNYFDVSATKVYNRGKTKRLIVGQEVEGTTSSLAGPIQNSISSTISSRDSCRQCTVHMLFILFSKEKTKKINIYIYIY
jgi:hypothetical protein